ncbi:hypothetical protein N824_12605 [Pedobacter sp. V48]|nr:hypothetical protein N824_12605 [Pedobacter sp. V48]
MEALILNYWWVVVALMCAVLNRYILRFFFGMVVVPEDRIGLVTKKFVLYGPGKELPDGRIIAIKGEAGFQGKTLAPGLYFGMWFWQYMVSMEEFTIIPEGKIGLIMAKDGSEIPTGNILGHKVVCDNFQDAVKFLESGGQRGRQTSYITSGSYRINTLLFQVSVTDMVRIQESMVGIVTTLDGLPIERDQIAGKLIEGHNNFQDFDEFINKGGNRGLQPQVVLAGSYNLNPWAIQLEQIPMTEIS